MQIALAVAKAQFAELVRRAEAGEEIELTRYGRPVVRITALKPVKRIALLGCMKGLIQMSDDINDGDAEIAEMFAQSEIFPT